MTVTMFGYQILISIDFCDSISPFSLYLWFRLRNSLLGVWKCGQTRSFVFHVIYQTRDTVFHRDIQTPRTRRVDSTTRSGVFLTKFEVFG